MCYLELLEEDPDLADALGYAARELQGTDPRWIDNMTLEAVLPDTPWKPRLKAEFVRIANESRAAAESRRRSPSLAKELLPL